MSKYEGPDLTEQVYRQIWVFVVCIYRTHFPWCISNTFCHSDIAKDKLVFFGGGGGGVGGPTKLCWAQLFKTNDVVS